jgi:beta-lactamase superfamily II metal-dependent hydrolase
VGKLKIKMLRAEYGDCFIISTRNKENERLNILVDGGLRTTYRTALKPEIEKILENKEKIDYIIITHIDEDHIMGILTLLEDEDFFEKLGVKEIFYNYKFELISSRMKNGDISAFQGDKLGMKLFEISKFKINTNLLSGVICDLEGVRITFLSPKKEQLDALYEWIPYKLSCDEANTDISSKSDDYGVDIDKFDQNIFLEKGTVTNNSSLAFLIEAEEKRILMMGDANPDIVAEELEKINLQNGHKMKLDLVKLSHHGGENSVSNNILQNMECKKYLISTNGKRFKHPRKKTLVDIMRRQKNVEFYLNYKRGVFKKNECQEYDIKYLEEFSEIHL